MMMESGVKNIEYRINETPNDSQDDENTKTVFVELFQFLQNLIRLCFANQHPV